MPKLEGLASIRVLDDGIAVYDYAEGAVVDLDAAKKIVALGAQVVDRPTPSLIQMQHVQRITRSARAFFAESDENRAIVSQAALLVGTPLSRTIGNFFLGLNRTEFQTRLFGDEAKALEWLRGGDA